MANPAPGFRNHPDHEITLSPGTAVRVTLDGHLVARSDAAVLLRESRYPARAYIPLEDIGAALTATQKTTHCPYKGDTVYFDVAVDGRQLADAAWSYQTPFDEMAAIAGLVAFDDRFEVTPTG